MGQNVSSFSVLGSSRIQHYLLNQTDSLHEVSFSALADPCLPPGRVPYSSYSDSKSKGVLANI